MSTSSWTISAATVVLTAKPTPSGPTSKPSSWICSRGNIKTLFVSSASTPPRNGHKTSFATLRLQLRDVPFYLEEFVEQYEGRYHDIQLPLPIRLV